MEVTSLYKHLKFIMAGWMMMKMDLFVSQRIVSIVLLKVESFSSKRYEEEQRDGAKSRLR